MFNSSESSSSNSEKTDSDDDKTEKIKPKIEFNANKYQNPDKTNFSDKSNNILNFSTRNQIILNEYGIQNVNSMDGYSDFPCQKNNKFCADYFTKNLEIKIISVSGKPLKVKGNILKTENRANLDIEFDIINAEASLVNAFRRILLAEVPTIAIEKVYLYQNTSVLQDEVLCHRLGLIPLKIDPRLLKYRKNIPELDTSPEFARPEHRILDTIRFKLKVKSYWKEGAKPTLSNKYSKAGGAKLMAGVINKTDKEIFENSHIYSKDLIWVPINDEQYEMFKDNPPRPVENDILIARLRPGQEINLICDAIKGIGSDHAKFSPVGTATYRLYPTIEFKEEISGKLAVKLQKCFPPGVIELEGKSKIARIGKNLRNDVISREVYRHEDLKNLVQLGRLKNHFIFNIESTGALQAKTLFAIATEILYEKCDLFEKELSGNVSVGAQNGHENGKFEKFENKTEKRRKKKKKNEKKEVKVEG